MKAVQSVTLTAAAPVGVATFVLPDSTYSKVAGVRMVADNDSATAVQIQVVVSRSPTPLADGGIASANALLRGDAVVMVDEMNAGQALVQSDLSSADAVVDPSILFSSEGGCYAGIRAVGLSADKTATVLIELATVEVPRSTANTADYLTQVVRFQDYG